MSISVFSSAVLILVLVLVDEKNTAVYALQT